MTMPATMPTTVAPQTPMALTPSMPPSSSLQTKKAAMRIMKLLPNTPRFSAPIRFFIEAPSLQRTM